MTAAVRQPRGDGAGVPAPARVVDIHSHAYVPGCQALVSPDEAARHDPNVVYGGASVEVNRAQAERLGAKLTDPATRAADMAAAGIDHQLVSIAPSQYYYWTDPGRGAELARMQNEWLRSVFGEQGERFSLCGSVPLQAPEAAVEELRYLRACGFRAVEVGTNVDGRDLDDPRFRPFFAAAQELGMLVILHPAGFPDGARLEPYYLMNVIGNPLDTTVALSRLVFSGLLAALPDLKLCCVHGGGFLPFYWARMDHAYRVRSECREFIDREPSSYLSRVYFDTLVHSPELLGTLLDRVGCGQVVVGTDYPYDMGAHDPLELLSSVPGLTNGDLRRVASANADALLADR